MKCFIASAVALATALASASTSQAGVIYSQNFDGGPSGFTSPNPNIWHVTQNFPFSSPNALGFVAGETAGSTPNGNYNGNRNNTTYSPLIALPAFANSITLTFQAANLQEGSTSVDRLRVYAAPTNTSLAGALLIASSDPTNGGVLIPINSGYNLISVDGTALAGLSGYLAFNYQTVDANRNSFPGARIDDIVITADVPEPATFAVFGALALSAFGVRRRLKAAAA